ncbi:uncharacterized protein BJX67DRAFT_54639 [Aspergillus lucknowensis]|uniref:Uncharacterized protein n=1 Tax=Aspergillus lucknowensis TaxID=176173 RepID=A0ABR4LUV9_9EURO
MCDAPFIPIFPLCFQCGTDQNPCRCKVFGPTLGMPDWLRLKVSNLSAEYELIWAGFVVTVVAAVVCYPASIFCGCCFTKKGKDVLGYPVKLNGRVSNAIPI